MADIAVVFHWSLASLDAMDLNELAEWRDHADRRSGASE
ncbi:MAG: GpE family phage tail protein [Azonexus sp.]|nr:GpE family phage tail protein [Azonexus sp.]MDZ4313636.1 GpE family phage tail protein [Azonexus sp.]